MNKFNHYFHDKQYTFALTSPQASLYEIISTLNIDNEYFIYNNQNTHISTSSQVTVASALILSQ
ncbi:7628_t:CDS:2, partial [Dentiscutata heterogama]